MKEVTYPLLRRSGWHCLKCMSAVADAGKERSSTGKSLFIELFSGSGHVAAAARTAGFETITIDIEEDKKPDICIDIINLRNSALPGRADVVWASIPCTVYSTLSIATHWRKISIGYRQYQYIPQTPKSIEAIRILNKTIRLIRKLKPTYYFIENPRGALRHFPQMLLVPYRKTISYHDYGFEYYKPTDIFTNCPHFNPKRIKTAVNRKFEKELMDVGTAAERAIIPPNLILEVVSCVSHLVK